MINESMRTGVKIGAIAGVIVWAVFGLLAGAYFGGYSTVFILHKLFGALEPTLIMRGLVLVGMTVGVMTVGSLCLVVGSLLGAVVGWVVSPKKELVKQEN